MFRWSAIAVIIAMPPARADSGNFLLQQTLRPNAIGTLSPYDAYGSLIDVDGATMAVAAPDDGVKRWEDEGSVAIFERQAGTWVFRQRLFAPDLDGVKRFGRSLDLRGDRLIVGAPIRARDDAASGSGAAYLYERVGGRWSWVKTLKPLPGQPTGAFGWTVALFGDSAFVGAPEQTGFCNVPCPTLFASRRTTTWSDATPWSAGHDGREIGLQMAIAGDGTMALGRLADGSILLLDAGSNPPQLARRIREGAATLPMSVAVSGNWLATGVGGVGVELYERVAGGSWQSRGVLQDSVTPGRNGIYFGISLALVDPDLVVTALEQDSSGNWYRGIRSFRRSGSTWTPQGRFIDSDDSNAPVGQRFAVANGRVVYQSRTSRYLPLYPVVPELVEYPMVHPPWGASTAIPLAPGRSGHQFGIDVVLAADRVLVPVQTETPQGVVEVFARAGDRLRHERTIAAPLGSFTGGALGAVVSGGSDSVTWLRHVGEGQFDPVPVTPGAPTPSSFGRAIALGVDTLAVSATIGAGIDRHGVLDIYDVTPEGVVTYRQRIAAPDPAVAGAEFAAITTLDAGTLVVASWHERTLHFYRRMNGDWQHVDAITDPSLPPFGALLSLRGDRLVTSGATGALRVYRYDGSWQFAQSLTIPVSATRVVQNADSVYVSESAFGGAITRFSEQDGVLVATGGPLPPSSEAASGAFGSALAVDAEHVYVGAYLQSGEGPEGNPRDGAVHVFREVLFGDGFE